MVGQIALVAAVILGASDANAQRAQQRVTIAGVRVVGSARGWSASRVPREPEFTLQNRTAEPRTITIRSVYSVAGRQRRAHPLRSNAVVRLAPGAGQTVRVAYAGDPLDGGVGAFTVFRFHIVVEIDGHEATIEASHYYVCRIPRRPTV
ncbi:MAG: hypothetical protein JNK05_04940 [Myxococcales bacterium]|nr:hypothetical protein [Myxococcales bacterium]